MLYRFGDYALDLRRGELRQGGERVSLEPKVLDLLAFLIERRDRLVTKDELLDGLWPGTAVTETALTRAMSLARRAIGDSAQRARWIRTEARRGYRFVGEVEVSGRDEAAPSSPRGEPFVGRDVVLDQLEQAWEGARAGRGSCVLLSGEAGIGKTRTARVFTERVRAAGGRTAAAWCTADTGAPPYWLWTQLLRAAPDAEGATALLKDLEPESRRSDAGVFGSEAERFRLLDRLHQFLVAWAREAPLLVFVDDLHWADRSSLRALGFLARELEHTSLLLLLASRNVIREGELAGNVAELLRSPGGQEIPLGRLDRAEVAGYLNALGDDSAAEEIYERSQGIPLFVRELARGRSNGTQGSPTLHGVIQGRVGSLPDEVRQVLDWAAVVGQEIELSKVVGASGLEAAAAATGLEQALREGLLSRTDPKAAHFTFSHELVREALLGAQPASELARKHRRIAEHLETQRLWKAARSEVAGHYLEALRRGETSDGAVRALVASADRAARGLAYDESVAWFEHALEALELLGAPDPRRRLGILLELGPIYWGMNQFDKALEVAESAAGLARELGDDEALGRAALLLWPQPLHIIGLRGRALLEEAARALEGTGNPLRGQVLARLAHHLYLEDERPERLLALCREAVALARPGEDRVGFGWVLYSTLMSCWGDLELEERRALVDEITEVSRALDWGSAVVIVSQFRLTQLLEEGRVQEVDREIVEVERHLDAQASQTYYRWYRPLYRGMRAIMNGELERAEQWVVEALVAGRMTSTLDEERAFAAQLFQLRIDQGRIAELEPAIRLRLEQTPDEPTLRPLHAFVLCEGDRLEEARPIFEAAFDAYEPELDVNRALTLTVLAVVCAKLGDARRAELLRAALLPLQDRIAVNLNAWVCMGSLHWAVGLVTNTVGDREGALDHLARAVETHRRLGMRPYCNRARLDLAVLLLEGSDAEARRGREVAAEALEDSRALGLLALAERAEALLAS